MKTQLKVFISAFRGNDGSMHDTMKSILEMNNLNFKEVVGSYQGVKEKSFMVDLDNVNLDFFKSMGRLFQQDSILFVNDLNEATLIFMDNRDSISLGKMKQVDKVEALNNEAFTWIPDLDIYLLAS